MSEDTTTTTEEITVQADVSSQPETIETQAVQVEGETQATDSNQTSSEDTELLEWASKKGIKTDDTMSLLKMAHESEKRMHSATEEAKALKNVVKSKGEEEGLDDVSQLVNSLKVTEFVLNHPDAREKVLDDEMANIINAKPYLANDLEVVYELAKSHIQPKDIIAAKQTGKKEALAQMAKAEKAAPPQASATTREGVQEVTDAQIAAMTTAQYLAWKKETGFNPFKS